MCQCAAFIAFWAHTEEYRNRVPAPRQWRSVVSIAGTTKAAAIAAVAAEAAPGIVLLRSGGGSGCSGTASNAATTHSNAFLLTTQCHCISPSLDLFHLLFNPVLPRTAAYAAQSEEEIQTSDATVSDQDDERARSSLGLFTHAFRNVRHTPHCEAHCSWGEEEIQTKDNVILENLADGGTFATCFVVYHFISPLFFWNVLRFILLEHFLPHFFEDLPLHPPRDERVDKCHNNGNDQCSLRTGCTMVGLTFHLCITKASDNYRDDHAQPREDDIATHWL
mmetsp:Transcript_88256/g.175370  ORF Transcript_88256/g.175370 Transcript_88256/m.175370 type:complete len:278 (+) Transcript_88256:96-929(+)